MATSHVHATRNGDYIDIGRVQTYYEVAGAGETADDAARRHVHGRDIRR